MKKGAYDVDEAQEKKPASRKDGVDREIAEEARRVEGKNYDQARAARLRLEGAAEQQRGTGREIGAQNERLGGAKQSALRAHENVGEAEQLASDIEHEEHWCCGCRMPFAGSIGRWWSGERREEREIEEIARKKDGGPQEEAAAAETKMPEGEEQVPGQHKTDAELHRILHSAQNMNREARAQSKMTQKQKEELQDINKVTKSSKRKTKETEERLKKGL